MTLKKYEPLRESDSLGSRIQKYFEDFPSISSDFNISFNPKIDISEDENNLFVDAEIPGIKKEDLKLTLQDNILTIKGEKKREEEKKEKSYYRNERCYGSFTRSFTLPVEVSSDKIDARFEDGTLKVKMEKIKKEASNVKEIELK